MDRRCFLKFVGVGLALGGLPVFGQASGERPNVLFIAVDDLNHWVGYTKRNRQVKTPNIDRLSKMGVSFTNAHAASTTCNPSRTALFSGMRPATSGCYTNKDKWKNLTPPDGITLSATFKKEGYGLYWMGKVHYIGAWKSEFEKKFDEYPKKPFPNAPEGKKDDPFYEPESFQLKDEDLNDWHSVDFCVEKLQQDHDKPFFIACGIVKPHLPFWVPKKYYDMFPRDEIEIPPHIKDDLADLPLTGKYVALSGDHKRIVDADKWKDAVQAYLACIAYADVCVGRLLDAYEKSKYTDNTIVILWGDHGWHLGEKEHWRKATLWEEATRMPFIWYVPGITKADTLCDSPVDAMSVYPTLCELAGIERPGHVEGDSIVKLLKDPEADWDGVALTSYGYKNHAVRTKKWRYIRYENGDDELYDHDRDEYEWKNLADDPAYAGVIKKLAGYFPTEHREGTRVPNMKKIRQMMDSEGKGQKQKKSKKKK